MFLKKVVVSFVIGVAFIFLSANPTHASLVTIDKTGAVVINVLSAADSIELEIPRPQYLEIKSIAEGTLDPDAKVSLLKRNGKINLQISTSSGEKNLDITNYKKEVIEIEERPPVEKVTISVLGDKFEIVQRGATAVTDYEINIEPKSTRLTLETPSGLQFLSVLPRQAVDIALRAKYINRIGDQNKLELKQVGSELAYFVPGDKVINVFDLFEYKVPVKAVVSASTGEILSVEQPTWLRVLGFLFV